MDKDIIISLSEKETKEIVITHLKRMGFIEEESLMSVENSTDADGNVMRTNYLFRDNKNSADFDDKDTSTE